MVPKILTAAKTSAVARGPRPMMTGTMMQAKAKNENALLSMEP